MQPTAQHRHTGCTAEALPSPRPATAAVASTSSVLHSSVFSSQIPNYQTPLSQAEEGGGGEKRSLIRDGSGRDGGGASSGGVPEVEEGAGDADG
jgi:hypothetical protein